MLKNDGRDHTKTSVIDLNTKMNVASTELIENLKEIQNDVLIVNAPRRRESGSSLLQRPEVLWKDRNNKEEKVPGF